MELGSNFELNLKKKIKEQNNNINKYLNNEFSIYMDSGRSALRVVTSRIKHGKILLPAYICKSVVDCFQEQYEICFYQLNQSLGIEKESIEKQIDESVSAVYIMHYFGKMQDANILEYIQEKTRNHNPRTVKVPLNDIAKTILERYKKYDGETLLPFISEQKYNQAIKEAFRLAGLNRIVTVLNPLTREPEQKYLYEVATTHTARRTFIGNMYKKVKDPDLVSSVSGHKEGSKAFRRYREIDDEMKQELVNLLN